MTILACRPWAELASLAALHGLRARLRMILGAMRTRLRGNVRRPAALEGRHCSDKFPGPERAKKRAVVRGRERTPDRKRGASGPGAKPDVGQAGEDEIRAKGPSSLVSAGQLRYGARWESDGRRARARAQTQLKPLGDHAKRERSAHRLYVFCTRPACLPERALRFTTRSLESSINIFRIAMQSRLGDVRASQ